jgi:hypothetical protein
MALDPNTAQALGELMHKLAHNPKTRKSVAKMVKEVDPDRAAAFTDIELDDKVEALREEFTAKEDARQREEVTRKLEAQRKGLLAKGYTEDQVKEIEEKVMPRYGISDYDAASVLWANENPPAQPTPGEKRSNGTHWEFPMFEQYASDPRKASLDRAHEVIDELRAGSRR